MSSSRIQSAPELLQVTADQRRFAESLVRGFSRLTEPQRDDLKKLLQAEDTHLYDAIHHARTLIESGQVVEVPRVGTPQRIDDVATKLGWTNASWQKRLLDALDGAGNFEKDGMVLASELVTGLRNPDSPRFLTTSTLKRLERMIEQQAGSAGALMSDLKEAWVQELAQAADRAGNKDEKITRQEIDEYLASNPQAYDKLALQNVAVMLHQIAELTGEPDPFRLVAKGNNLNVVRTSYVGSYDGPKVISTCIAQAITASDLERRGDIDRTDNFHRDQLLPEFLAADPKDYRKTGYDMGHLAAAADGATLANVEASFSLLNMAPQLPELNRFSWRYLEASVRDLIVATGARAVVYTGALYLDAQGKPLPDDQLQRLGKRKNVAIPTHCYKTVLLQFPGGQVTTLSYILPNTKPLPTKAADCQKLIQASRTSIAEIERLSGVKMFDGLLPEGLEKEIKNDKTATVPVENAEGLAAAKFLWGPNANPKTWQARTTYDVDASLELVAGKIRQIGGAHILDGSPLERLQLAFSNQRVSRREARDIAATLYVGALQKEEVHEAAVLVRRAITTAGDPRAVGPLRILLTRIEKRASELA